MAFKVYNKFIVALAAACAVLVSVTADGDFTVNDGAAVGSAFVGALAVYAVRNLDGDDVGD